MKISPTEVRKKTFKTSFRGFEKEEVAAYLDQLSESLDQVYQENLEVKRRLQQVEDEAKRLKDVEDSLFRTLKTAEDTGASIIEEANAAADQIIEEANANADKANAYAEKLWMETKEKADQEASIILNAAENKAAETLLTLREKTKSLLKGYGELRDLRNTLQLEIRHLASTLQEQLEGQNGQGEFDLEAFEKDLDELTTSGEFSQKNISKLKEQLKDESTQESIPDTLEISRTDQKEEQEDTVMEDSQSVDNQQENGGEVVVSDSKEHVEAVSDTGELAESEWEETPENPVEDPSEKENLKTQSGSFFDQID